MVDFKDLVKKNRSVDVTNFMDLFDSLDRHASHTELRPAQEQALESLTERRSEKDLILKMSTGAGKTAVGLLYLLSFMEETEAPVVYLCPTVQLVEQVLEEAVLLGIPAVAYPADEPYPPPEASAGKALIVCTYAKLFNAKSTFDRTDVLLRPTAIVLDDAHAGVEEIRDKFTLTILEAPLVQEFKKLFSDVCGSYKPGVWQDISTGVPYLSLEVPYWLCKPLVPEVLRKLSPYANHVSFMFVWPFLRDTLRWCRYIISGNGIEIIPEILPIHKCEAYAKAQHRLFMSATLADDSVLVREIGCDLGAARLPIVPKKDYGFGERMVLAPSLIDKSLNRSYVMKLAARLANKTNVVVLSPSERAAREWESVGAKVVMKDDVSRAIKQLRNPKSGVRFVVFAQRYDGVDLPDNACRVLIMDGLPSGESITDKYDMSLAATPGGIRNRLVYRIEQGMGRAVRSHVDYAVIILAGADLANFIARNEVLKNMSPDTRAQLKLALDLASIAKGESPDNPSKALASMISQCLDRKKGWKDYYQEKVRAVKSPHKETEIVRLEMAASERTAFHHAVARNYHDAVAVLRTSLNQHSLEASEEGWYLQRVANYMLEANAEEYLAIQQAAYEKNNLVFCPPSVNPRYTSVTILESHSQIIEWFAEFENPNGAIATIQDLRARLSYDVSPETLEQALLELTPLLGAKGSRPEKEFGKGPDVLWLWPTLSLVIEAKNQNQDSLHKKDAGQLHQSLQWFRDSYPTRPEPRPIVVAKIELTDPNAQFPPNTRVLVPTKMNALLDNIERFYQAILQDPGTNLQPKRIAQQLPAFGIAPEQFVGKYTILTKVIT